MSAPGVRLIPLSSASATGKAVNTATTTILEVMENPIQITMRGATAMSGMVWETTRMGAAMRAARGHSEAAKARSIPTAMPAAIPAIPSAAVVHAAHANEDERAAAEARIVAGAGSTRSGRRARSCSACHAATTAASPTAAQAARAACARIRAARRPPGAPPARRGTALLEEAIAHHVCGRQAGGNGVSGRVLEEALRLQVIDVALPSIEVGVSDAVAGVLPVA